MAKKINKNMKKTIKILSLTAMLVATVFALSSFTKVTNMNSEKSCTVTIKYQNGDPAESITVTASYSSGGQHDFKTNSSGVVTLTWESSYIKALYIKGNKYEVDYSDGKSYTLTLKQNNKYD